MSKSIALLHFGLFDLEMTRQVAEQVKSEFASEVVVREGHLDLSEYYDSSRRQYNANQLLANIDSIFGNDQGKTIGLFNIDLFIPILTFIYGQALLNGRTAIASLYRLNNERYGLARNDNLLADRFTKEIIHELGHTFGLVHCSNISCVMKSSTYIEEIDMKDFHLCMRCRHQLQGN